MLDSTVPRCQAPSRRALSTLVILALLLAACAPVPPATPASSSPQQGASAAGAPATSAQPTTQPPNRQPEKVVMGTSARHLGNLPIYLAAEYGLFAAEGLAVEVVTARTDVTIAALVAGEMDYTTAIATSVAAIVAGSPLMVVHSLQEKPLMYLVSRPEITSASALRGGTIGHGGTRGSHWQATVAMVRHLGLDPARDVQLISTGDVEKGVAMLLSGSAAAVTLTPPYDSLAVKEGYHRLVDAGAVLGPQPETGLVAPRAKLAQNPAQVRNVVRALLRGVRYQRDHPADVIALVQRDWDLDADSARLVAESMLPVFNPTGELPDEVFKPLLDNALKEAGITASDLTVRDVVDWTFVRDARQTLQP